MCCTWIVHTVCTMPSDTLPHYESGYVMLAQVGAAAGAAAEAVRLVDKLRARLRAAAAEVAAAPSRPRVMILDSLQPLSLGNTPLLLVDGVVTLTVAPDFCTSGSCPAFLGRASLMSCGAGGLWLPEVVDLCGGDQELLEPGSAGRAIAWDEVRYLLHACVPLSVKTHEAVQACANSLATMAALSRLRRLLLCGED